MDKEIYSIYEFSLHVFLIEDTFVALPYHLEINKKKEKKEKYLNKYATR